MSPSRSVLDEVQDLVIQDQRLVFIGSDLGAGLFDRLAREAPERFFMEGIQEQYLIGMAAGLAKEGFIPIVSTIATFLTRRCLEQIIVDVALHRLPVRLLGSGAGLAYAALGPTHIAVDDFALLRAVPGMTVLAPADDTEANVLLRQSLEHPGPVYLRLPRGGERPVGAVEPPEIGRAVPLRKPGRVLLIATGAATATALDAADLPRARELGIGVLHVHTVEPLDREALCTATAGVGLVVTLEEHLRVGGLGSAVLEALHDTGTRPLPMVVRLGLPAAFVNGYGTREEQLARHGLTPESVLSVTEDFVRMSASVR